MKYSTIYLSALVTLLFSATCVAAPEKLYSLIALDGRVVELFNDMTWKYRDGDQLKAAESENAIDIKSSKAVKAKTPGEAIEVWDKSLVLTELNYSETVALHLHYHNKTGKAVVGITTHVKIINPFGKVVLENTYNDEVMLAPLERKISESYWHFDKNPFLNNLPYNRLWQIAQNGTAKIQTKVLKVIFEDGTVLSDSAKPQTKKKPKKGEVI